MTTIETTSVMEGELLCCQLSLERCAMYAAHLCACVHHNVRPEERLLEIVAGMERELAFSRSLLGQAAVVRK